MYNQENGAILGVKACTQHFLVVYFQVQYWTILRYFSQEKIHEEENTSYLIQDYPFYLVDL